MTFRDRMKVSVSHAEDLVTIELQRRGLCTGMQRHTGVPYTYPDWLWQHKRLLAYLDGPPHMRDHQIQKDELIDQMNIHLGYTALRLPYRTPLSKKRLQEITDQIEKELRE